MVIQEEMASWSKFRRGLRRDDQEALDDLFRAARMQLAGSAYAARPIPFESIAMAMMLAQHRRIRQLEQDLDILARRPGAEDTHDHRTPDGGGADDHRLAV